MFFGDSIHERILAKNVKLVDIYLLPEKWCVKLNQEIFDNFSYALITGYHHSIRVSTNKWSNNIEEGFTEITSDQFKKHVLNEKV